jgi:hypothetical protein
VNLTQVYYMHVCKYHTKPLGTIHYANKILKKE